jgi:hypothetical protein
MKYFEKKLRQVVSDDRNQSAFLLLYFTPAVRAWNVALDFVRECWQWWISKEILRNMLILTWG